MDVPPAVAAVALGVVVQDAVAAVAGVLGALIAAQLLKARTEPATHPVQVKNIKTCCNMFET